MKYPPLFIAACVAAIGLSAAPARQDTKPESTSLRVTIVIPQISRPDGTARARARTLINQQAEASFDVIVENISDKPIRLPTETSPLSFEITEADGKVTKPSRSEADGSRLGDVYYLDPGDYRVINVTYATQEQYISQVHHAPPFGHIWSPEFPFKRTGNGGIITLRAIYEERPQGKDGVIWSGRAVSAPVEVKLIQG